MFFREKKSNFLRKNQFKFIHNNHIQNNNLLADQKKLIHRVFTSIYPRFSGSSSSIISEAYSSARSFSLDSLFAEALSIMSCDLKTTRMKEEKKISLILDSIMRYISVFTKLLY